MNHIKRFTQYMCVAMTIVLAAITTILLLPTKHYNSIHKTKAQMERIEIESIIRDFATQEDIEVNNISYTKEDVYFTNNKYAGYVVEFVTDKNNGYAIVFNQNDNHMPLEVNFGKFSPFYGKPGKNICPGLGRYIKQVGNKYLDAETMEIPNSELTLDGKFYASGATDKNTAVPVNSTIKYKRGYVNLEHEVNLSGLPFYSNYSTNYLLSDKDNTCANIAGLLMLNYWNMRTRNKLLKLPRANISTGTVNMTEDGLTISNGHIQASKDRNYPEEFCEIFYKYMKTNSIAGTGGTTPNNIYVGFEKLIKEYGYRVERKTNLTWGDMVKQLDSGVPIFITSTDYYFTYPSTQLPNVNNIAGTELYDFSVDYEHWSGLGNAHTFVAYGYKSYMLYDEANSVLPHPFFLKIADTWGGIRYFNHSYGSIISSAAIKVLPPA